MTELKEEHFEVISENRAREFEKKQTYKPLTDNLFIEESMIDGQGLFANNDIPKGTDLGISHIEIEKDKMAPLEMLRTPLGGFINHSDKPNCVKVESVTLQRVNPLYDHNFTKWDLLTIKNIEAGEELTISYTFYKI